MGPVDCVVDAVKQMCSKKGGLMFDPDVWRNGLDSDDTLDDFEFGWDPIVLANQHVSLTYAIVAAAYNLSHNL